MNTIRLPFMENRPIMCFGYHKYTHLIWSTDKLDIYRKSTVFCMHREIIHCQSQVKPRLNHHMIKIIDIMLKSVRVG